MKPRIRYQSSEYYKYLLAYTTNTCEAWDLKWVAFFTETTEQMNSRAKIRNSHPLHMFTDKLRVRQISQP
jgi:hypothetical protein